MIQWYYIYIYRDIYLFTFIYIIQAHENLRETLPMGWLLLPSQAVGFRVVFLQFRSRDCWSAEEMAVSYSCTTGPHSTFPEFLQQIKSQERIWQEISQCHRIDLNKLRGHQLGVLSVLANHIWGHRTNVPSSQRPLWHNKYWILGKSCEVRSIWTYNLWFPLNAQPFSEANSGHLRKDGCNTWRCGPPVMKHGFPEWREVPQ